MSESKEPTKIFLDHCISSRWTLAQTSFVNLFISPEFDSIQQQSWNKIIQLLKKHLTEKRMPLAKKWIYYFSFKKWGKSFLDFYKKNNNQNEVAIIPRMMLFQLILEYWNDGEIEKTWKLLIDFLQMPSILMELKNKDVDKIFEMAQYFDNYNLSQKIVLALIEKGDYNLFKIFYQLFFFQFSSKNLLEIKHRFLWEEIYHKVNKFQINEGERSLNWGIVSIDLMLITDIYIMQYTQLPLPYYKKTKDLIYTIILRKNLPTLYSTLWRYFHFTNQNEILKLWEKIFHQESKIHYSKGKDALIQKWYKEKKYLESSKPYLSKEMNHLNSTFDLTINDNYYTLEDKRRYQELFQISHYDRSRLEVGLRDKDEILSKEISWFSQKNKDEFLNLKMELLNKNWQQAINIIEDETFLKKNYINKNEKEEIEIVYFELLLKTGKYEKVLSSMVEKPLNKIYKYLEAEAYRISGNFKKARECYEIVYKIDPQHRLTKWRVDEMDDL